MRQQTADLRAFTYTGEQTDTSTGREYLRARYYDAETGRFLSRDPLGGRNNPTNMIDPSGLYAICGYNEEWAGEICFDSTEVGLPEEVPTYCDVANNWCVWEETGFIAPYTDPGASPLGAAVASVGSSARSALGAVVNSGAGAIATASAGAAAAGSSVGPVSSETIARGNAEQCDLAQARLDRAIDALYEFGYGDTLLIPAVDLAGNDIAIPSDNAYLNSYYLGLANQVQKAERAVAQRC